MSYLQHHTWLIILISIIISFLIPSIGIILAPLVQYMLMILMFFSLLSIKTRDVLSQLKHIKEIIIILLIIHGAGIGITYLIKSFVTYETYLGLLLISVTPTGISAVFLSKLYGGNLTKALPIVVISNLVSPFIVPYILINVINMPISFPVTGMIITMTKLIIIPYIAAMIVRRTPWIHQLRKQSVVFSQVLLFLLILGVVSPFRFLLITNLKEVMLLVIFTVFFTVVSFVLSFLVGQTRKDKIAFGITGSFKNFTLAIVTALSVFSPQVALPAIVYAVVNNMMLIPLEFWLKDKD